MHYLNTSKKVFFIALNALVGCLQPPSAAVAANRIRDNVVVVVVLSLPHEAAAIVDSSGRGRATRFSYFSNRNLVRVYPGGEQGTGRTAGGRPKTHPSRRADALALNASFILKKTLLILNQLKTIKQI